MTTLLLLTAFASLGRSAPDTNLKPLVKEVSKLEIYLLPPPDFANSTGCFYYAELLVLEINKSGKITDYSLNDHAPLWLKTDFNQRKENKQIDLIRIDSLAKKSGIKNCKLVFPLVIESINFPCAKDTPKEHIDESFYKVNGKNLAGNVMFMDPIIMLWSMEGKR